MELTFVRATLDALQGQDIRSKVFKWTDDEYRRDKEIDSRLVDVKDFPAIKRIIHRPDLWSNIENRRLHRALTTLEQAKQEGSIVKKLEAMPEATKQAMETTKRKWIFKMEKDTSVPYAIINAVYRPKEKHGRGEDAYWTPACVNISAEAIRRGNHTSISMHLEAGDIYMKSVAQIFQEHGWIIETDELLQAYDEENKRYVDWSTRMGDQFTGIGVAEETSEDDGEDGRSRYSWRSRYVATISLDKDGQPARLVMDDQIGQGKDSVNEKSGLFMVKEEIPEDEQLEQADDEKATERLVPMSLALPVHPYVRCFNLNTHEFLITHLSNVELYKYDKTAIDKLVLPPEVKELADALTGQAIAKMEDIVKGKAMGVIVLSSGVPGTGKTLTAEVYSEAAERPLYSVQCTQLGTSSGEIEKNLTRVLNRAMRWRCILLIDEADVYIRERGKDIDQNAIVGVFLRLLEYYNGILFLTTNRATTVDDAIVSRCTAHIRYKVLGKDQAEARERLWRVLCSQYKVEFKPDFVDHFPMLSGRSIRQILRLARVMADKGKREVGIAEVKWAAKFIDHDVDETSD